MKTTYKTYVWHSVLCDYTAGLVCVRARNVETARRSVQRKFPNSKNDFYSDPITLKANEIAYVYGGG